MIMIKEILFQRRQLAAGLRESNSALSSKEKTDQAQVVAQ
jgi:hypothetical protein